MRRVMVLLGVANCALFSQELMLMNNTGPGVTDRLIVLNRPWRHADAESVLRQFFDEMHRQGGLYRLTVVPLKEDAYLSLIHGNDVASYEYTTAEIQRLGLPRGPVGQVLGVGGSAIMMFREGQSVSKQVLGGMRDPTVLAARGRAFRLLAFWLTISRQNNPTLYGLTLFAKCDRPLSIAAVFALTEQLARLVRLRSLTVQVRTDDWFIESPGFPAVYPFSTDTRPPIEGVFRRAPNVSCYWTEEIGAKCGGLSFRP
jgi:hypothetical protein